MKFKAPSGFELFKERRRKLVETVKSEYRYQKGVIIVGADFEVERWPFTQDSSFYYLTGVTEPAALLCMYLDGSEVLYVPRFGISRSQWVHTMIGGPEDARKIDVDKICYLGDEVQGYVFRPLFDCSSYGTFLNDISGFIDGQTRIFTVLDSVGEGYFKLSCLWEKFQAWIPGMKESSVDISSFLHDMRSVKDEYEIDLMYKAVQLTTMGHNTAAAVIAPDKYEYEVQAAVEYVFSSVAGSNPAFPSIVASGKNTTVLHYLQRDNQLKDGDLVVVDVGAEYGYYSSDLTRTYPVNGTFSSRQREIYMVALETQEYVESIALPGMYLKNHEKPEKSLHHLAVKFLEQKGLNRYFCHGIGHFLGLDVHDVGDYSKPLQVGNVITIEPGLYIPEENVGVRIEDDYVVADDGVLCLSYELAKQPEKIEEMVQSQ